MMKAPAEELHRAWTPPELGAAAANSGGDHVLLRRVVGPTSFAPGLLGASDPAFVE
jgi:hypothetical protein